MVVFNIFSNSLGFCQEQQLRYSITHSSVTHELWKLIADLSLHIRRIIRCLSGLEFCAESLTLLSWMTTIYTLNCWLAQEKANSSSAELFIHEKQFRGCKQDADL